MRTMTIFLSVLFIFFLNMPVLAEIIVDTAWVRRYNGPGNGRDEVSGIEVDGSLNTYIGGSSYGTSSEMDYIIIKYSTAGNILWMRRYNGPTNGIDESTALTIDDQGNIYVTGRSWGGQTGTDYATIKYFSNGDTAWVRRFNGALNSEDWATALAVDDFGNVYVTGVSSTESTGLDYVTVMYDSTGNIAWVNGYNGLENSTDVPTAIATDAIGNVYVTGRSLTETFCNDFVTIKYQHNGDTAWVRRYNGPDNGNDEAYALAVDHTGNVFVAGLSADDGIMDRDFCTIKYHPDGDIAWVRRYNDPSNGNEEARALALDGTGNVHVTGGTWWGGGQSDYATVKYDADGNELWVRRYWSDDSSYDVTTDIGVDNSGNVIVTGLSGVPEVWSNWTTLKYNSSGDTMWVKQRICSEDCMPVALSVDFSGNVVVTGIEDSETNMDCITIRYIELGNRGDVNQDGLIDPADIVYFINYLFRDGDPPDPLVVGDCNCDEETGPGDVVFLINYLFRNGPSPDCP
jgi:hypothetical protein